MDLEQTTLFMAVIISLLLLVNGYIAYLYVGLLKKTKSGSELAKLQSDFDNQYKNIVDNLQDTYFQSTLEGEILILSNSVSNLLGYSRSEMVGQLSSKFSLPGVREKFLQALRDSGGKLSAYESQMIAKDGELRWISVSARFRYNDDDEVIGIEGTVRDISEKKALEGQLGVVRERMKSLLS